MSTKHVQSDLGLFESFINTGTFPKQIAVIETFSKFRKIRDCACVQSAKFSKGHNRIDWHFYQLSTLKLNLGIFPSKYSSIVRLFI